MADLEKLIREHAYWSDLRSKLKEEGSEESSKCISPSCIEEVYNEWRKTDAGYYNELPTFEEFWEESVEDGQVCQHCQKVRKLKSQRVEAGRRLGVIRGAITRVGRRLLKDKIDINNPF